MVQIDTAFDTSFRQLTDQYRLLYFFLVATIATIHTYTHAKTSDENYTRTQHVVNPSVFCVPPRKTKAAAQLIKNSMDKKFGASWHCAIGEGFGFEITYQQRNMIYVFYGQIGVLTFK